MSAGVESGQQLKMFISWADDMEDALINAQALEFLLRKEGHKSTIEQIENIGNRAAFGSNYAASR
ncbi:MAG: hypothetical protein ACRCTX_00580 [Afipia sp.]